MAVSAPPSSLKDLEVTFKPDLGKAVIEGKTAVPFQSFVKLVLQRKVLSLMKQWGKEPVIMGSELLATLASAPQDSQENRANLVLVSAGVGTVIGVTFFAVLQAALLMLNISFGMQEYAIIIGSVVGLGILSAILMRVNRVKRSERIVEAMEGISSFLSSK